MRLLLWGVIVVAVVMLLLHLKKITIQRSSRDQTNSQTPKQIPEEIMQCAHCGLYIPASEAVLVQPDLAFCSEEHRLKHFSD